MAFGFIAMDAFVIGMSRLGSCDLRQNRIGRRLDGMFFGPSQMLLGSETTAMGPTFFGAGATAVVFLAGERMAAVFF